MITGKALGSGMSTREQWLSEYARFGRRACMFNVPVTVDGRDGIADKISATSTGYVVVRFLDGTTETVRIENAKFRD